MLIPTSTPALASKRRPEPPHVLAAIKRLAADHVWQLAALPYSENSRLNEVTGVISDYWFNTFGAAMYCLCKKGGPDADWHSVLMENRRNQKDMLSVLCTGVTPRGNVCRLGELQHYKVGRKAYYTKKDLDNWLAGFSSPIIH